MSTFYIDKTTCWFGISPDDQKVHCYLRDHRLCDSATADDAVSVVTQQERAACGKCIERLNTATHDSRGAHYGRQ